MAIRIPILTSFDPKGLRQANAEFAKLQNSIGSLGKNFAVAGVAIAAGTTLLGKAVKSASAFEAEFEGVNQVFGSAAKSVQAFAEQAAQSAGLSATEALQASKTFGLFATGAGLGVQEAAKFSTTMVQLAGDLGSFNDVDTPEALAAIQSGLMGQSEPLRKFGVFLDDARLRQEALNMGIYDGTGSLSTNQKMMASYSAILAQTTVQQGDFVKYQETLGNQLKTIGTEFDNLTKDIGLMLIPAITEALPQIKEMARQLGEELKSAIQSVDWQALTKTIVDLARFFTENAGTILQVVAAVFALNTAYKLFVVTSGIVQTAIALQTYFVAQATAGIGLKTIAINAMSTAMKLIPFVAVVAGIALVTSEVLKSRETFQGYRAELQRSGDGLTEAGKNATAFSLTMLEIQKSISPVVGLLQDLLRLVLRLTGALKDVPTRVKVNVELEASTRNTALNNYLNFLDGRAGGSGTPVAPLVNTPVVTGGGGGRAGGGGASTRSTREGFLPTAEADAIRKAIIGLGETTVKQRNATIKAVQEQFAAQAHSFAITQEAQQDLSQVNEAAKLEAEELARSQEEAARKEADALAERERVYNSFLDSVKSTFSSIKNSIMGAFDLTQLGGSTNAITRNMDKLLTRMKAFATNISKLSSMGLNPALLQQVISAGPMAGARLAESLVMGGTGALAAINAGFGEFGSLSSQIAQTGTESRFNTPTQQSIYNINVDGGVGSGATIGKAIVDAIKSYERTSGAVWQGA
jgi:hypothetical protein